jgi:peptidyl-tRNA hydrolase, PTH1 family
MKLVVGLGNPGEKYKNTRHNVGFLSLDYLLSFDGFMTARPGKEFKSEVWTWQNETEKVLFIKPQTYMNDSGQALKLFCNFYKMDFEKDILIIHDELDLPFGGLKLSLNSSAAGHNGVQSIIDNLGTQNFQRLRIGIESRLSREEMPTENFVLQNFTEDETIKLSEDIFPKIKLEVEKFIKL